jgi:hypothetical protein
VDWVLNSPFEGRKELAQNEIRKGTLEDGLGRALEIQQFVVESLGGLGPVVEE